MERSIHGFYLVDAVMKIEATFRQLKVHDDLAWVKKHGHTIEELYRVVKVGEKVKCRVYKKQSYFLTTPYYDVETYDDYHCGICIDSIELLEDIEFIKE